jgi:hypothetical protein
MEEAQQEKVVKPPSGAKLLGTYSNFPGVQVSVFDGDAGDYLAMRAAQLAALTTLIAMEGFESQSVAIKNSARWLLADISNEVNLLIPLALKEAVSAQ